MCEKRSQERDGKKRSTKEREPRRRDLWFSVDVDLEFDRLLLRDYVLKIARDEMRKDRNHYEGEKKERKKKPKEDRSIEAKEKTTRREIIHEAFAFEDDCFGLMTKAICYLDSTTSIDQVKR